MIIVKLPELNINDVEVFIAEELPILIDVRIPLDVEEAGSNLGPLVLPDCYLPVELSIGGVEDSIGDAYRIPILELRGLLQEVQTLMDIEDVFQQRLEILLE